MTDRRGFLASLLAVLGSAPLMEIGNPGDSYHKFVTIDDYSPWYQDASGVLPVIYGLKVSGPPTVEMDWIGYATPSS
jgi:hypothetical protein